MKKLISVCSLCLAVLCFSILLVGCGGKSDLVDVSGDYKKVESETEIQHLDTAFEGVAENYEFEMKVKMLSEGANVDVCFSGLKNVAGDFLIDVDMTLETNNTSVNYKGQTYYNASERMYYENLNGKIDKSSQGKEQYSMVNSVIGINYIRENVLEGVVKDFTELEIAVKDSKTKLHYNGQQVAGADTVVTEIYLIFDDSNKFEAFKLSAVSGAAENSVEFKTTDKKIDVPSFVSSL